MLLVGAPAGALPPAKRAGAGASACGRASVVHWDVLEQEQEHVRDRGVAGEEPHEWPSLLRDVIADRSAQHRIGRFERIEDGPLGHLTGDLDADLAVDLRQLSQVSGEDDPDHGSV